MGRALIVKLGAIGDVVMAIPAVFALHQTGMTIDWLCGPTVGTLLRGYSWIHVIEVNERSLVCGRPWQRVEVFISTWRALLGKRYDLVATLYYDARWRLLTQFVSAGRRLSLNRTDRNRRLLPGRHHTAEFYRILLNLEDTCREEVLLPVRPDNLPPSPLPASTSRRIGIVPAGASNVQRQQILRRWPATSYSAVIKARLAQNDEIVLLGGAADVWVREHLHPFFSNPDVHDLIGATSLPELIAVMDTCDVVLTHDTGPLHLAALSRAQIIALFGPTDPGSFLPRRQGVQAIRGGEHLACRPCHDGRDFAPCHDNLCMQSIPVDVVLHAIQVAVHRREIQGHVSPPDV